MERIKIEEDGSDDVQQETKVSTDEILKLFIIENPSKLENALFKLNDNSAKEYSTNYMIDALFLSRVCESLSLFPVERLIPQEDTKLKVGESEDEEKVDGRLIGLVSDIAGMLSDVSKKASIHVTVSDVVDRCTKAISNDSTRKVILETIGAELPCFGVEDAEESGGKRLTRMLAKVLLAIISKVQLMYTLHQKFDGIWKDLAALNIGIEEDDLDIARKLAWTIQSILSVDRFAGSDYRISLMAGSSYIVIQLFHAISDNKNKTIKSQSEEDKALNLSIEEEAISVLSMMPTSGSSPIDIHSQFLQVIASHTNLSIDDVQHILLLISDSISTHLSKDNTTDSSNKRKREDYMEDLPSHLHQLYPHLNTVDKCEEAYQTLTKVYNHLCAVLCQSLLDSEKTADDDHKLLCDETPDFFHSLTLLMLDECALMKNERLFMHLSTDTDVIQKESSNEKQTKVVPSLPQASPMNEASPNTNDTNLSFSFENSFFDHINDFSNHMTLCNKPTTTMMDFISLIDWISILSSNAPKPSMVLLSYFHAIDTSSLWNDIISMLNHTFVKLVDNFHYENNNQEMKFQVASSGELSIEEYSFESNDQLQIKVVSSLLSLYYHSLESIITQESMRLQCLSHSTLLHNFSFHRALAAVCCECVLKSLSCDTINFNTVLSLMDADPFEFLKVCEGFVRSLTFPIVQDATGWQMEHTPPPIGLPTVLRNHLYQREEQILDNMLWAYKKNSKGFADTIIHMQEESHWPPPCLVDEETNIKDIVEESKCVQNTLKKSSKEKQQYAAVSFVFRKLMKLTARRICKLCQKLCLIDPVVDIIWKVWKNTLQNAQLLYNRHIDQLILCTVYGVCRVIKVVPEVSFVRIIDCYRLMNPSREKLSNKVTRKVRLKNGFTDQPEVSDEFGNVITLYNKIYVPVMRPCLLEYQKCDFLKLQEQKVKQQVKTVEDAAMIADRAASTASILHELGGRKKNAVVSPSTVSSSGFDSDAVRVTNSNIYLTTATSDGGYKTGRLAAMRKDFEMPRTRAIYNFGDSSSKDLSLINKTIRFGLGGHR